jgi:uncharacterized iron-regulated membrane protein
MKPIILNKLHRYVGITLAPFLMLQTLSGLFLDFGLFRGSAPSSAETVTARTRGLFDSLLVKVHFGAGLISDCYHVLVGLAITWMAVTGWMLFLRIRRVQRRSAVTAAQEVRK